MVMVVVVKNLERDTNSITTCVKGNQRNHHQNSYGLIIILTIITCTIPYSRKVWWQEKVANLLSLSVWWGKVW